MSQYFVIGRRFVDDGSRMNFISKEFASIVSIVDHGGIRVDFVSSGVNLK